jgi:hypothetical protein
MKAWSHEEEAQLLEIWQILTKVLKHRTSDSVSPRETVGPFFFIGFFEVKNLNSGRSLDC